VAVTVHIPAHWRDRTGGRDRLDVQGSNLREVINNLDAEAPGLKALITDDQGEIRGEIAIAINSEIPEESHMFDPVPENSELFLIPAIGGGA